MTTRELLDGLLLLSGNDAAVALACLTAGSEEAFVPADEWRGEILGLHDTHFASASGLDGEGHYTTARDLARLAAAAMENQDFARIVGQKYSSAAGRQMKNHNKLLFASDEVRGIKTGYTKKQAVVWSPPWSGRDGCSSPSPSMTRTIGKIIWPCMKKLMPAARG